MTKDEWYKQLFERLDNSKFRSSFHLKQKDIDYINEKGLDTIRQHAKDFIAKREAPAYIANDGKQTPMRGHPVFIAQHATATCCRECILFWRGNWIYDIVDFRTCFLSFGTLLENILSACGKAG